MNVKILQISAKEGMEKCSKIVEFFTQKLFQIRACGVNARKAKHLDVTTMFTYSYANTPFGQSEHACKRQYSIVRIPNCCILEVVMAFPFKISKYLQIDASCKVLYYVYK